MYLTFVNLSILHCKKYWHLKIGASLRNRFSVKKAYIEEAQAESYCSKDCECKYSPNLQFFLKIKRPPPCRRSLTWPQPWDVWHSFLWGRRKLQGRQNLHRWWCDRRPIFYGFLRRRGSAGRGSWEDIYWILTYYYDPKIALKVLKYSKYSKKWLLCEIIRLYWIWSKTIEHIIEIIIVQSYY